MLTEIWWGQFHCAQGGSLLCCLSDLSSVQTSAVLRYKWLHCSQMPPQHPAGLEKHYIFSDSSIRNTPYI